MAGGKADCQLQWKGTASRQPNAGGLAGKLLQTAVLGGLACRTFDAVADVRCQIAGQALNDEHPQLHPIRCMQCRKRRHISYSCALQLPARAWHACRHDPGAAALQSRWLCCQRLSWHTTQVGQYVLRAAARVKAADLEQALLMLPFHDALRLLGYMQDGLTSGSEVCLG